MMGKHTVRVLQASHVHCAGSITSTLSLDLLPKNAYVAGDLPDKIFCCLYQANDYCMHGGKSQLWSTNLQRLNDFYEQEKQRSGSSLTSTSFTSSRSPVEAAFAILEIHHIGSCLKWISKFLPLTQHFVRLWRCSFAFFVTKLQTSPARYAEAYASPTSVPPIRRSPRLLPLYIVHSQY